MSVSLVTYQGRQWLERCVASVLRQDLGDLELLVLDNGSTDGSAEWLEARAVTEPRMTVERGPANLGYAAGHNRLIEQARGELVLLLNQDAELDPGFLSAAAAAFEADRRVGSVQARVLRMTGDGERTRIVDTTGLVMSRDRRVACRGQGRPETADDLRAGPVWGADGPVPVHRRAALLDARLPRTGGGLEVLDEDFWTWGEDVDLAWRLRRLGWNARYEPRALAWHARSSGGITTTSRWASGRTFRQVSPRSRVATWANHRLAQVKNDRADDHLRDLPWILRREATTLALILVLDPSRLRAFPRYLRGLPAALRKRRALRALIRARSRAGR